MPLFEDYHRTVVGFHGTQINKALSVVSGFEELEASHNPHDWLGHGIYFWEHGPKQAWQWAKQRYPGKKVAVVAAMIRLGNCLDLLDPDNANMLCRWYDEMLLAMKRSGETIPRNVRGKKYLDCWAMEYAYRQLQKAGEYVDSARAVYVPGEGKRLWPSSWMSHDTHIQLCVRNTANIIGCWLANPAKGME